MTDRTYSVTYKRRGTYPDSHGRQVTDVEYLTGPSAAIVRERFIALAAEQNIRVFVVHVTKVHS